jgi:hypothetical protein
MWILAGGRFADDHYTQPWASFQTSIELIQAAGSSAGFGRRRQILDNTSLKVHSIRAATRCTISFRLITPFKYQSTPIFT